MNTFRLSIQKKISSQYSLIKSNKHGSLAREAKNRILTLFFFRRRAIQGQGFYFYCLELEVSVPTVPQTWEENSHIRFISKAKLIMSIKNFVSCPYDIRHLSVFFLFCSDFVSTKQALMVFFKILFITALKLDMKRSSFG